MSDSNNPINTHYCSFRCCESQFQFWKIVISLHYNFIWWTVYTIYFRSMDNFSLTCELYNLGLLNCQLIFKFPASPEDNSSVLLKCCVVYFVCCDNGNSSKPYVMFYILYHCQRISTTCHIFFYPPF